MYSCFFLWFLKKIQMVVQWYLYLAGGLEYEFYFSIQLGISSSQLTSSYFSEG